jgi:(2Fe-2S) ferredoxin
MPKPLHQVLVCTNARPPGNPKGSCAQKGSEALADRLKTMVKERGLADRVMVNRTSCLKHCSLGPTITVQPGNTWYARVGPDDLEEICREHLEGGRSLDRLAMPDIPWE